MMVTIMMVNKVDSVSLSQITHVYRTTLSFFLNDYNYIVLRKYVW